MLGRSGGDSLLNAALALLLLVNFAMAGLLPLVFFRRDGAFNVTWFLTALPFILVFVVIVLAWMGWLTPALPAQSSWSPILQGLAVPFAALSICLMGMTVAVHRVPLALWHQDNDAPVELVTWGPYARIRHPFYSCFLLAFVAALLAFPGVHTAMLFIYVSIALTLTARREERRLCNSSFGAQYLAYMRRTGRFIPTMRRASHG